MQLQSDTSLQNGKYRIIKVLGPGRFGITYLFYDLMNERYVAVKELNISFAVILLVTFVVVYFIDFNFEL